MSQVICNLLQGVLYGCLSHADLCNMGFEASDPPIVLCVRTEFCSEHVEHLLESRFTREGRFL